VTWAARSFGIVSNNVRDDGHQIVSRTHRIKMAKAAIFVLSQLTGSTITICRYGDAGQLSIK
jgi:hypothetical protein